MLAAYVCETVNPRHEKEYVIDSLALALRVEEQGMGFAKQRQQSTDTRKEARVLVEGVSVQMVYVIAEETNIQRAGGLVEPPCETWYPKIE